MGLFLHQLTVQGVVFRHPRPPVAYNCCVKVFKACNARIGPTTLQLIMQTCTSRYSCTTATGRLVNTICIWYVQPAYIWYICSLHIYCMCSLHIYGMCSLHIQYMVCAACIYSICTEKNFGVELTFALSLTRFLSHLGSKFNICKTQVHSHSDTTPLFTGHGENFQGEKPSI